MDSRMKKTLIIIDVILIISLLLVSTNSLDRILNNDTDSNDVYSVNLNRPAWLLNENQLPKGWGLSSEMEYNEQYYLLLKSDNGIAFSLETVKHANTTSATDTVNQEFEKNQAITAILYQFFTNKVDLNLIDAGYAWEIKSPCCYSRGVTFSIDSYYIYVFGSQQSSWYEIDYLYNLQIDKLLDFLA